MSRRSPPLPSYLSASAPAHALELTQTVAFRDCDPMGVLWHGNYLAYAEAARNALGDRLGCGVARLHALGLFAPVVRSQVVHHAPARPGDALTVAVGLYPTRQPRLYHRYRIAVGGVAIAEAETEQVLTDRAFGLLLAMPPELAGILAG